MFVTSKRCFVNCVAQFMDLRQIAEANYYVCDVSGGSRQVSITKEVYYDEDGTSHIREKAVPHTPSISRFHVVYSDGSLDPRQHVLNGIVGVDASQLRETDAVKLFQNYLSEPATIGNVYNWFYEPVNKPTGNGLMFLIINDDQNARVFGHTICQFLSTFLGEDIEFVDAQMRPQLVPGYPHYQGNKAYAERVLRDQRDYALYTAFINHISTLGYYETQQNLMTFLEMLDPNGLMHLYELVFPTDPLPPGNYTTDQVKKILIGKTLERIEPNQQKQASNLYTSNVYLDSLIDEMDRLDGYGSSGSQW